jgi:hypothetical protein
MDAGERRRTVALGTFRFSLGKAAELLERMQMKEGRIKSAARQRGVRVFR